MAFTFNQKFWGSGVNDGKGVRKTRTKACLRSSQVLVHMGAFVRRQMFMNACEEVATGFANIASITASTYAFVDNTQTELSYHGIFNTRHVFLFVCFLTRKKNKLNV